MDLPWNPAVLEQRIGRIYRLGQKHPIDVYNIVSEQGIESRIAVLVDSKHAFFKGLFDGDTDTIQFGESSSFLSRIQKLIDPSAIAVVASRGDQAEAEADTSDDDIDIDINDEAPDPLEELIEAADEAEDTTPPAPEPEPVPEPEPEPAFPTPVAGQVGEPLATAALATTPTSSSGVEQTTSPRHPRTAPQRNGTGSLAGPRTDGSSHPPTVGVRELFAQLQVRREPATGKVVIEAPAEAAGALSALFEGMAALLQSVSQSGESPPT